MPTTGPNKTVRATERHAEEGHCLKCAQLQAENKQLEAEYRQMEAENSVLSPTPCVCEVLTCAP